MSGKVPSVIVRPGRRADAEWIHGALLGIAKTVKELHKVKSTPADIERHGFGEQKAFRTLIAEVDGDRAGLSLFFPSFSTWIGRPGGYVQDLYVEERFRDLGLGALLVRHTAAAIRETGGCYLRLSVDTRNHAAQRFYTRLGIALSDTEQIHAAYGDAFDALANGASR